MSRQLRANMGGDCHKGTGNDSEMFIVLTPRPKIAEILNLETQSFCQKLQDITKLFLANWSL